MILNPISQARAAEAGLPLSDLKRPCKKWNLVRARHHFWWLLVTLDGFSYARAGRVTGHHYTTVLYGIEQHKARSAQERAA